MDPPYYRGLTKKTLQTLARYDILSPGGFLVVQHFSKDELPEDVPGLTLAKLSRYGDTCLTIYRKKEG